MWDVILIVIFSKVNAIKLVCLPNSFLFIISVVSILVKEVLGLARSSQEQALLKSKPIVYHSSSI